MSLWSTPSGSVRHFQNPLTHLGSLSVMNFVGSYPLHTTLLKKYLAALFAVNLDIAGINILYFENLSTTTITTSKPLLNRRFTIMSNDTVSKAAGDGSVSIDCRLPSGARLAVLF